MTTAAGLCKDHDVGYFKAGHGADACVGTMAYDIRPDLQLDLDPVRGLGLALDRRFGLGAGFAFTAGRVVRAGFPRSAVGGYAVHGLVRAGLQGVQAGRLVAGLVLRRGCSCVRRRRFRGGGLQVRVRLRTVPLALRSRDDRSCLGVRVLGLCGALGRPGLARGDRGPLLAFEGPVHRGEVGFELAPPFRRGLWLVFGSGLPLSGCVLRELAPLQLGLAFPAASLLLPVSAAHFS